MNIQPTTASSLQTPTTITVSATNDPRWAAMSHSEEASLFVAPPWFRAIEHTYGLTIEASIRIDSSGRPTAGIAYCAVDDSFGRRLISSPFCDFCDPLGTDPTNEWPVLIEGLTSSSLPVKLRVTSLERVGQHQLTILSTDLRHEIDLSSPSEERWAALDPNARRNIRKATSTGITVRFDSSIEAIDSFYAMHTITRRVRHGLLAQPRRFFHAIHDEFAPQDGVTVALAELDGSPIAGILLLEWNGRAYYKFNASQPDSLGFRPNDLLMWECIQWSQMRGNDRLDLGLSSSNQEGLVRYKRKYATFEGYVWTLSAGPPRSRAQKDLGEVFQTLTTILVDDRVPLDLSEQAAGVLYRYFA